MLPSLTAIDQVLVVGHVVAVVESRRLGLSYVPTLPAWRHRFNEHLDRVADLGFDETFVRMWNFYLAYSAGRIRLGYLDDWQLGPVPTVNRRACDVRPEAPGADAVAAAFGLPGELDRV